MTDKFTFNATDVGLPTQRIIFERADCPVQEFSIPELVLSDDTTQRFWMLYNKLVELGAIPDRTPILVG
jgi:hypothetical protein